MSKFLNSVCASSSTRAVWLLQTLLWWSVDSGMPSMSNFNQHPNSMHLQKVWIYKMLKIPPLVFWKSFWFGLFEKWWHTSISNLQYHLWKEGVTAPAHRRIRICKCENPKHCKLSNILCLQNALNAIVLVYWKGVSKTLGLILHTPTNAGQEICLYIKTKMNKYKIYLV